MTLHELSCMSIFSNFQIEIWCFDKGKQHLGWKPEWRVDDDWSAWPEFLREHRDWRVYGLNTHNSKLIVDIMR